MQHADIAKRADVVERISLGIACCQLNGRRPEILLVRKRFTYAFNQFIHGKYNSSNNEELISLFSGMTLDEKIDINSLNFMQMWYRVWLNSPRPTLTFTSAKHKFEKVFATDDGPVRLRRLLACAAHSQRVWEIPKGRRKNKAEADIHCAVREFGEETGIEKKEYSLIPGAQRRYSYIDGGVRYTVTYYFALARHTIIPRVHFGAQGQIDEVAEARWMNIDEIRAVDYTGHLTPIVRPILRYIRRYYKR